MALAPMKTLANRFVLDVFVIIERAINGIVYEQRDTTLSNFVCWWQFLSRDEEYFSRIYCTCRPLFSSAFISINSSGCVAALHCMSSISHSRYFFNLFGLIIIQILLLRSTFGLFPHHFVEHFRGRCAQDVVFGKRLKLLAGLVFICPSIGFLQFM